MARDRYVENTNLTKGFLLHMASQQKFHKGDSVEWSSGKGSTTGTVQKKVIEDQKVDGNKISASESDPRYLVENDNTRNVTGHKVESLSKSVSKSEGSSSSSDNSSSSSSGSSSSRSSDSSSSSSSNQFEKGDAVKWETSQGTTTGTVKKKLTNDTDIKGHTAKASEDDPQYLVESESTGAKAAHKPSALESA